MQQNIDFSHKVESVELVPRTSDKGYQYYMLRINLEGDIHFMYLCTKNEDSIVKALLAAEKN